MRSGSKAQWSSSSCFALELRQPLGVGPRRVVDESILQQGGEHKKHAHPRPDVDGLGVRDGWQRVVDRGRLCGHG